MRDRITAAAGRLWLFVAYSLDGITVNGTRRGGRY